MKIHSRATAERYKPRHTPLPRQRLYIRRGTRNKPSSKQIMFIRDYFVQRLHFARELDRIQTRDLRIVDHEKSNYNTRSSTSRSNGDLFYIIKLQICFVAVNTLSLFFQTNHFTIKFFVNRYRAFAHIHIMPQCAIVIAFSKKLLPVSILRHLRHAKKNIVRAVTLLYIYSQVRLKCIHTSLSRVRVEINFPKFRFAEPDRRTTRACAARQINQTVEKLEEEAIDSRRGIKNK